MKFRRCNFFFFAGLFLHVSLAVSQDRIFTYTYQTQVLAPGQSEIEFWNTLRWGRTEYYRALDQRIEFETGLFKNLQTAFYLNLRTSSTAATLAQSPTAASYLKSDLELSFSNEWKYKLLDPVADPLGLAFYGEYTIGSAVVELEPRLIIDKVVGRTLLAFNVTAEFESEQEIEADGTEKTERSTEVHLNLAAGFHMSEGLHIGVEVFSQNGVEEGALTYSVLFAGPTISYAADRFWANITFMPQLTALKGATEGGLLLSGSERYQTRLLFSYEL